jgi:hypothetical protein
MYAGWDGLIFISIAASIAAVLQWWLSRRHSLLQFYRFSIATYFCGYSGPM